MNNFLKNKGKETKILSSSPVFGEVHVDYITHFRKNIFHVFFYIFYLRKESKKYRDFNYQSCLLQYSKPSMSNLQPNFPLGDLVYKRKEFLAFFFYLFDLFFPNQICLGDDKLFNKGKQKLFKRLISLFQNIFF